MSNNTPSTFDAAQAISSLRSFLGNHPRLEFPCLITYDQGGNCATLFDSLVENTDITKGKPPRFIINEGDEKWNNGSASYINGRPPYKSPTESVREPFHARCWYVASPDDADRIINTTSDHDQLVSCRLDLDVSCEFLLDQGSHRRPPRAPIGLVFPNMTWKSLLRREMERESLLRMTHCTAGMVRLYESSLEPGPSAYSIAIDLASDRKELSLESDQFGVDPTSAKWASRDRPPNGPQETLSSVNLRYNVELDPESETVCLSKPMSG